MSGHVEWADANYRIDVELYAPDAEDHPDTWNGDELEDDDTQRRYALAIGGDSTLVIDGDLEQLREIVARALALIDSTGEASVPGWSHHFIAS